MEKRKRRCDIIDMVGKRFGRLIVLSLSDDDLGYSRSATWICKCDCGKIRIVNGRCLRNGTTKSCGCYCRDQVHQAISLDLGVASFNGLLDNYKRKAKNRKLVFDLTRDEFKFLTSQYCYYCGKYPNSHYTKFNCNGVYEYNGIDRKDNTKGYTIDNCVSCCETCNRAKLQMSEYEFKDWIHNITIGDWYNEGR